MVTVNEGVASAVAAGRAFITVQNGGLTDWIAVRVLDPEAERLPAIDQTTNVSVAASGFRVDPNNGQIVQQVLITNAGATPLHTPLVLVIQDLPDSVIFHTKTGSTQFIAPLGAPYVFVDVPEGSMFRPGTSGTAELRFLNPQRVPITYTPKIYTASAGER